MNARPSFAALVLLTLCAARAEADDPRPSGRAIRDAATKGLALVEKAAANYPNNRLCFSCHHQTLPMLAMVTARGKGLAVNASLLQSQADFTHESFAGKQHDMREGKGVGGGAMTVGYGLWALELAGRKPDETTDAMVEFLRRTQRNDGSWTTGNRPPLEESSVTCTVLAVRGIENFAPKDSPRSTRPVKRAASWLTGARLKVQEDRAFRLLGLSRLDPEPDRMSAARKELMAAQREDGGWASRDDLPSDAYATGQTLAWLGASGMAADDPVYRRGIAYLLATQYPDGSWKVETRSKPIQVFFENGDPHGKHQFISTPAACWAVVALAMALPEPNEAVAADPEPFDLVIRGGRVVDGTGNPWFLGDVAVRGDRIAAVGRLPEGVPARREIDARGLVVAPGFIDVHSHSDTSLLTDGAALSKVTQGVTTEVLGEDTSGGPAKGKLAARTFTRTGASTLRWETLGGYFDAVEESGTAVNVASYVGLGSLLGCVLGDSLERPTPAQRDEIAALLDEAMRDGALGLSTMLASPRELNVTTDDLVALGKVVKRHGGIYSSHIRNEGTEVFAAIDEAIAIGERAGIPVDVIHLKIADQTLWGKMDQILSRIEAARGRGVNVQANVYPYTRGNNDLVSILPPWAHEGGTTALLARLKDHEARARIKADVRKGLPGWYNHYTAVGGDWSRMLISARLTEANRSFQGKSMDLVLAEKAKNAPPGTEPLDLFLDFLAEERGSVSTIYAHHTEADMNLALARPWVSIGSDGSALAVEGPLRSGHPHPRSFGTFPRVLGVYARDRHVIGLEDAVRKMTSLNATKLGISDRGLLRPGMVADLTVFDPAAVIDRATYLEPFQYSAGVVHVLVNGRPVLENGKPTGQRPGRALRHKGAG